MIRCDQIRERLSSYLDGELAGDRGSAVRGHLRECAACRQVSVDEASLRDGLRALPPLDPSPSLWAGVQAQLAAAEVADAKRPRWRRLAGHWRAALVSYTRPIMVGGALALATVTLLWWRAQRGREDGPALASRPTTPELGHVAPVPIVPPTPDGMDVTADLTSEAARIAAEYAAAAQEVLALAATARVQWSDTHRAIFDERVAELRTAITRAGDDDRAIRRAWRALIRYVQTAVARDEVAIADVGGVP